MAQTKKLNRSAFNEKLLHRYLLELFYGIPQPNRAAVKSLLPDSLHSERLNLVVPESRVKGGEYRPDLTLYFKGKAEGVPVEVKWTGAGLKKNHQYEYLRKNEGILISLDGVCKLPGIHSAAVDLAHFQEWFARSARRLWRDAVATHISSARVDGRWVVVLRGDAAIKNFQRMNAKVEEGSVRKPFWAFKNSALSIRNHLDIAPSDEILFLFVSAALANKRSQRQEGNKLIRDAPDRYITVNGWARCRVQAPYYMALEGVQATFFESGTPRVNDRIWPHFIDFDYLSRKLPAKGTVRPASFKRGRYTEMLADSFNHGGVPVPIDDSRWLELLGLIGA